MSFFRRTGRSSQTAVLLATSSIIAIASTASAFSQEVAEANTGAAPSAIASAAEQNGVAENVLVTGSLISGAQAVGVSVTSFNPADFTQVGANSITDILRDDPAVNIIPSLAVQAANQNFVHLAGIQIHQLGYLRTLLLVDGMRYPLSNTNATEYDASIVPELALDRVDILADGASATYGSDAVAGVVNLVLRRGYDGATTQASFSTATGGDPKWEFSQLWGRTWDGGDLTLTYDYYNAGPLKASLRDYETADFTAWGLNNVTPLTTSVPGVVSLGTPTSTTGTTCTNCYSVPLGQNGVGLTWAQLLANQGVKNEVGLYKYADLIGPDQRNSAVATFDQEIWNGVSLFGEAFYSNHRSNLSGLPSVSPSASVAFSIAIPTGNPYYPIGAPTGLKINYDLAGELSSKTYSWQLSGRYSGGFNLDLPDSWKGKLFFSADEEHSQFDLRDDPNPLDVSAALGYLVTKTDPYLGVTVSYTKPANVPYLNVFCDPNAFTCNSASTLDYIEGEYRDNTTYIEHEFGANFNGPLYNLPGGTLEAAVGADYRTEDMLYATYRSYNSPSVDLPYVIDETHWRQVYAFFGQVNIPVFGAANAIPLFQKLEIEVSARYDHYNDFGGTTNPKVAATWIPLDGLTLKGSWGNSFRAPTFNDLSAILGKGVGPANIIAGGTANNTPACLTVGGTATPGSVAAILNPTCSASLQYLGGATVNAGVGGLAGLTRPANYKLGPETATTLNAGFDFAPTFVTGLDFGATYFSTNINNVIQSPTADLNNPVDRQYFLLPGDPTFAATLAYLASNPAQLSAITASNVSWIFDGAVRNLGTAYVSGIDFNTRYDFELGQTGDWHAGINGTYILHNILTTPGFAPQDAMVGANATAGIGNRTAIQLKYRGEIGWASSDNIWNVTAYINYQDHYFTTQNYPPSTVLPANWSNIVPSFYTFDLSLGYNTADRPANDYLKNLNFQFVVQNVFDKQPPFVYVPVSSIGTAAIDGSNFNPLGRVFYFSVTKKW